MKNRIARMEILQANGNTTTNYLSMNLVSDFDNFTELDDEMFKEIFEDGYVKNTKLHRRWVMAQTFRALNFHGRIWTRYGWREVEGWNEYVNNRYSHNYQYTMMEEELKVLCALETKDIDSFNERSKFFTKDVVVAACEDYMVKLKRYVGECTVKKCKGEPYVKVVNENIFMKDLNKKLYRPILKAIDNLHKAENYTELYKALQKFNKTKKKMPYETAKSTAWKDAFKGAGAYYTLKNLIMFHDCRVIDGNTVYSLEDSIKDLNDKLVEYEGYGWKMHGYLKKVIADNGFDFQARMRELNSEN